MAYDRSEFTEGEPVGVFQVSGGRLRVSDPCYRKDTWCAGVLENVKDGEWEAYAFIENYGPGGFGGNRVKALSVKHRETEVKWNFQREVAKFEVGVDSGQAGFFNEALYPDEPGDWDGNGGFYDRACNQTISDADPDKHAGTITEGVVSSSGFGDGGYTCTYALNEAGAVVAARIEFIPDEDETEDDIDDRFACLSCGDQFNEDELNDGVCDDCRREDEREDEPEKH